MIVTGCFVQKNEKELSDSLSEVDHFFNLENIEQISNIFNTKISYNDATRNLLTLPHYAYLKISEGCNYNCSYCTIPSIRGRLKSKPMPELIEEAKFLAEKGVKELIIIAQDIGNYGIDLHKKRMLVPLIKKLVGLKKFKWIRLIYLNPQNITEEIAHLIADNETVCNYLDIPIQHASNKILKSMNRNNTQAEILHKIKMLREIIPDLALRTSVITGFPGESETDFEILLQFLKTVKFTRLGAFKYYKEEGTKAADLDNQIPEKIKTERYNEVMKLQKEISENKLAQFVDKKLDVIIDRKINNSVFECRTRYDSPEIDGIVFLEDAKDNLKAGDFARVKIVDNLEYDLIARKI